MDLLLGSFADTHLAGFTAEQLDTYESILLAPDPDLYSWITGAAPIPPEQDNDVLRLLATHRFSLRTT